MNQFSAQEIALSECTQQAFRELAVAWLKEVSRAETSGIHERAREVAVQRGISVEAMHFWLDKQWAAEVERFRKKLETA